MVSFTQAVFERKCSSPKKDQIHLIVDKTRFPVSGQLPLRKNYPLDNCPPG